MEHSYYQRQSTQQRGSTLESNAKRFAKEGEKRGLPSVPDPAATMKRMYDTFIGKRLSEPDAKLERKSESQAWYIEEERRFKISKNSEQDQPQKKSRSTVGLDKGREEALFKIQEREQKRRQEAAQAEAANAEFSGMDPKYASIIKRFRKDHSEHY